MNCIYQIYLNDDVYVGSTNDFNRRISQHKHHCNNPNSKDYNYPVYQFIRDNGGWDKFNKKIITETDKTDKELLELERYYIKTLKSNLNSQIPTRTDKEYREDNKDKIKEQKKEHYENNKEKILEKQKVYQKDNKEQIKEQRKQWYEDNKEQMKENQKKWYENNKDKRKEYCDNNREKINKKQNEKIICDICNSIVIKRNLLRHQRTNKCIACKLNTNAITP